MYSNNTLNIQNIYEYIFPMLKKISLKYAYVGISDNEIKTYLMDKITKNIKKIKDVDHFLAFVEKKFLLFMDNQIKEKLRNEEDYIELIKRYIDQKAYNITTVDEIFEFFDELENFFEKYNFIINKDQVLKITHGSIEIKKILEIIYNSHDKLDSNHFSSNLMLDFLDVYCQIKKLDSIEQFETEDNELELFSSFSENEIGDYYSDDLLKEIFNRTSRHQLLSDEEQKMLIKRAQLGDVSAKELLVERNSRLIISIARKYTGKGVDFLDLYQEGAIGFIEAINRFDLEKENTLSTYAIWWIKSAILKCINMNARTIRLPIRDIERLQKINAIQNEYSLKYNREATVEELAELLQVSVKKIIELINDKGVISLNNRLDSSETEFEDLKDNGEVLLEDRIAEQDANDRLKKLIDSTLTVREKHVIIHRFGFYGNSAKTLEEIGRLLGVTRENIRKIESRALYKLQMAMAKDNKINTANVCNNIDLDCTSIYDCFVNHSKHLIDKMILCLDKESIILLKLRFGANFSTINPYVSWKKEEYDKLKQVLNNLRTLIDTQMNKTRRIVYGYRNLYYYFENYSKIEIDDALDQLSVKDILFLEEIFGADFEKPAANPNEEKVRERKFYQIKHKITSILKGNTKTIYKIFANYTEDQVNDAVVNLLENERDILNRIYGEKLKEAPKCGCWISGYHKEFTMIKKKIYNFLLSNYPSREDGKPIDLKEDALSSNDVDEAFDLESVNNPAILKSVLNMMPRLEVKILEKKYGLKGDRFSTKEIAEDLKISEEEIIEILRQALTRYKEIFNSIARDNIKNQDSLILSRCL